MSLAPSPLIPALMTPAIASNFSTNPNSASQGGRRWAVIGSKSERLGF
ncbi:hypothetical protein [Gloeomargarita sp.]